MRSVHVITTAAIALGLPLSPARVRVPPPLRIETYVADSMNFHVVSVILYGRTEAILVDCQNRPSDGAAVAERIAATGRHLKAIFITHPDHDHYMGAAAILARFPGTPVYMTSEAIALYNRGKPDSARLAMMRSRMPAGSVPDSFVTPQPVPAAGFTVDGQKVEVIPNLQGDVEQASNSALWIPAQSLLVAGDVVFSNVHLWLGSSSPSSRVAWRAALDRLAALHPRVVVAGHKPGPEVADAPAAIAFTRAYLEAFDEERGRAAGPDVLARAMTRRFPDATVFMLAGMSARIAYQAAAPNAAAPPAATPPAQAPAADAPELSGSWSGTIGAPNQPGMAIVITLARSANGFTGHVVSPSGEEIPMGALRLEGRHVVMTFPGPNGDATIDGTVSTDGREIAGTFSAGGRSGSVALTRNR